MQFLKSLAKSNLSAPREVMQPKIFRAALQLFRGSFSLWCHPSDSKHLCPYLPIQTKEVSLHSTVAICIDVHHITIIILEKVRSDDSADPKTAPSSNLLVTKSCCDYCSRICGTLDAAVLAVNEPSGTSPFKMILLTKFNVVHDQPV